MPPLSLNLADAVSLPVGNEVYDVANADPGDNDTHPVIANLTRLAAVNLHFAGASRSTPTVAVPPIKPPRIHRNWAHQFPDLPTAEKASLTRLETDDSLDVDRILYVNHILRDLQLMRETAPEPITPLIQYLLIALEETRRLAGFVLELSAFRLIASHPQCKGCAIRVPHIFKGKKMEIDVLAQMAGETVLVEATTRGLKKSRSPQMKRLFALTDALDQTERARLYCIFGIFGAAPFTSSWRATPNAFGPMTLVQFHQRLVTDWGPYSAIQSREKIDFVPDKILNRVPQKIITPDEIRFWYGKVCARLPWGKLRNNLDYTNYLIENHFTQTRGKGFWQKLALHLWKTAAECATDAEAAGFLSLIDTWVAEKNFAAVEDFYRLTVLEPAQEQ